MSGKRKASDDAPGSSRPPKARRGVDDEGSSLSDYGVDSRSDSTYPADDERSSHGDDHVGGGDSSEESEIADLFDSLNLPPLGHNPAEGEELAAAAAAAQAHSQPQDDQPAEMDVQPPPPPTDQSVPAAEVADQSVAAAALAPGMVTAAAYSVLCSGCGSEPALVRLVPVEHACLCLPCRSSPTGRPHCEFCDGHRR